MKLSLEWLSEFVDLAGLEPEQIASELSLKTAEVEGTEVVEHALAGVEVARIVSAERLSPASALRVVRVRLGNREAQTVCGAPNVELGQKVAFAGAGSTVVGGERVTSAEFEGVLSEGLLCSAGELGLG